MTPRRIQLAGLFTSSLSILLLFYYLIFTAYLSSLPPSLALAPLVIALPQKSHRNEENKNRTWARTPWAYPNICRHCEIAMLQKCFSGKKKKKKENGKKEKRKKEKGKRKKEKEKNKANILWK
jgi:hypothetical protein